MFTFSKQMGSTFLYYFSLFLFHYFRKNNKMLSLAYVKDLSSERSTSCFKCIKRKLAC